MRADRLQELRELDAGMGEGPEALQLWPAVYTHRRELLAHVVTQQEEDAKAMAELSAMLEPVSGGTTDLRDLVYRMKMAATIRAAIADTFPREQTQIACGAEFFNLYGQGFCCSLIRGHDGPHQGTDRVEP